VPNTKPKNVGNDAPADTNAGGEGLRSRTSEILGSIIGLISAAGILGTLISTYFQGRSWDYQNRTARIEKDGQAVVSALEDLDKIIDEKWISTYEMNDAIKTRKDGDKLQAATIRFYGANKDWERQHQKLASTLQLDVDSQFGVNGETSAALVNTDCLSYTLNPQDPNRSGPLSVRALLDISYNCHNIIKGNVDRQLQARDENNTQWPAATSEPDPGRTRLNHIWWVNKVLQCLMLERALELRHRSPQVPIIPSQMPFVSFATPTDSNIYEITERELAREDQCADAYRSNPDLGIAASKPR
jgi:hypothetical protein